MQQPLHSQCNGLCHHSSTDDSSRATKTQNLERQLCIRPTREELCSMGVLKSMDGIEGELQRRQEKARAEAILNKKLKTRPNRVDLVNQGILKSYVADVNPDFAKRRESLERQLVHNRLNKQLDYRPGTLELINRGYLVVGDHVDALVRQGMVPFQSVEEVSEDGEAMDGSNHTATTSFEFTEVITSPSTSISQSAASLQNWSVALPATSPSILSKPTRTTLGSSSSSVSTTSLPVSTSVSSGPATVASMSRVTRFGSLTFHSFNPRGHSSHKQQVREQQQRDLLNLERHASLKHHLMDELRSSKSTAGDEALSPESQQNDTSKVASPTHSPAPPPPPLPTAPSGFIPINPANNRKSSNNLVSFKLDSYNVATLINFCRLLGIRPTSRRKRDLVLLLLPHVDSIRQLHLSNNNNNNNNNNNSSITSHPSVVSTPPHFSSETFLPGCVDQSPPFLAPQTLPAPPVAPTAPCEPTVTFRHSISTPQFFQSVADSASKPSSTFIHSINNIIAPHFPLSNSTRSPQPSVSGDFVFLDTSQCSPSSIIPNQRHNHFPTCPPVPRLTTPPPPAPLRQQNQQSQCHPMLIQHSTQQTNVHHHHVNNTAHHTFAVEQPSQLDKVLQCISEFTKLRNELQAKKRHSSCSGDESASWLENDLQQQLSHVESELQRYMQEAAYMMQQMHLGPMSGDAPSQSLTHPLECQPNSDSLVNPADPLADILDLVCGSNDEQEMEMMMMNGNHMSVPTHNSSGSVAPSTADMAFSFHPVSNSDANNMGNTTNSFFVKCESHPVFMRSSSAHVEFLLSSSDAATGIPGCSNQGLIIPPQICHTSDKSVMEQHEMLDTRNESTLESMFLNSPMQTNVFLEEDSVQNWLSQEAIIPNSTIGTESVTECCDMLLPSDDFLAATADLITDDAAWDDFMSTEPFATSIR